MQRGLFVDDGRPNDCEPQRLPHVNSESSLFTIDIYVTCKSMHLHCSKVKQTQWKKNNKTTLSRNYGSPEKRSQNIIYCPVLGRLLLNVQKCKQDFQIVGQYVVADIVLSIYSVEMQV